MNILMLTAYTENLTDFAKITSENMQEYAQTHGYDFINETTDFYENMHPAWSKIKFIKKHLSNYDYIFWVDIDVLIMNFNIRLENFLKDNLEYDLIFNEEQWWSSIDYRRFNSGVFFIKNTQFSINFLNEVLRLYKPNIEFEEQGAMWIAYNKNNFNCKEKTKFLRWDTFNSSCRDDGDIERLTKHGNTEFIWHMLNLNTEQRVKVINKSLKYIKKDIH